MHTERICMLHPWSYLLFSALAVAKLHSSGTEAETHALGWLLRISSAPLLAYSSAEMFRVPGRFYRPGGHLENTPDWDHPKWRAWRMIDEKFAHHFYCMATHLTGLESKGIHKLRCGVPKSPWGATPLNHQNTWGCQDYGQVIFPKHLSSADPTVSSDQ